MYFMERRSPDMKIRRLTGWVRRFELLSSSDIPIATLFYEKVFGRKAVATAGNRQWTIRRSGFWNQTIEIKAEQSPYYRTQTRFGWWRRYSVRAEDGRTYLFKRVNWWKSVWAWYDDREFLVLEIVSRRFSMRKRGDAYFSASGESQQLWLFFLGWFILLAVEDDEGIAAA